MLRSFTSLPIQLRKDGSLSQRANIKFQSEWNKSASQQAVFGSQSTFGHLMSLFFFARMSTGNGPHVYQPAF